MSGRRTIRKIDTKGLLAKVRGEKKEPKAEGPAKTDEQIQETSMEKARRKLSAMSSKPSEEVSDEETTIGRDEDEKGTMHGDSVETVQRDSESLLDKPDAAELRQVSESLIEDEERLSEVERREEAPTKHDMPPPPPGHEVPEAEEPMSERDIIPDGEKEPEDEMTQLHDGMQELPIDDTKVIRMEDGKYIVDDEEAGEATQVWLGSLDEGEVSEAGFGGKPVTNKDLLRILKGVDGIIEEFKGEIAWLAGELHKISMETYANASDLDEVVPKVDGLEKDLEGVESVIDDENLKGVVRQIVQEDGEMTIYDLLKTGAPELLDAAVARVMGREEKPEILEASIAVLSALKLEPLEGLEGEKYINALEECEEKYGEEGLKSILEGYVDLDLEKKMDKATAEVVRGRAKFILENMGDE